jgi:hypothetical protein
MKLLNPFPASVRETGRSCLALFIGPLLLSACTADQMKSTAYDSLYQNECLRRNFTPQCDPAHKPYRDYDKERRKVLEDKP